MLKIDPIRRNEVFGILLEMLRNNEYPFSLKDELSPQSRRNFPPTMEWGSVPHQVLLLNGCLFMKRSQSLTSWRALRSIFELKPKYFDPKLVADYAKEELATDFKRIGLHQPEQSALWWIDNLHRLNEKWDGVPKNILWNVSDFQIACERILHDDKKRKSGIEKHGFNGFQEKMVSMFIYFMMSTGFIPFWNFPFPTDIHIFRMVFATKIAVETEPHISLGVISEYNRERIRMEVSQEYCALTGTNPLDLSDALWIYDQVMCFRHPGNQSRVINPNAPKRREKPQPKGPMLFKELEPPRRKKAPDSQLVFPKFTQKGNGRDKIILPMEWEKKHVRDVQMNGCGVCKISHLCSSCFPSAYYFHHGKGVVKTREKIPCETNRHFFAD